MNSSVLNSILFIVVFVAYINSISAQLPVFEDWQTRLSMRKIGHELLLSWADSTSRVAAIEGNNETYLIQFEPALDVEPKGFVSVINRNAFQEPFAKEFLVEVLACNTSKLEYSYYLILDAENQDSLVPCMNRPLPKGCYDFRITIIAPLEPPTSDAVEQGRITEPTVEEETGSSPFWLLIFVSFIIIFGWLYHRKRNPDNTKGIQLGTYLFNPKHRTLVFEKQTLELTEKEYELLQLLYNNLNETVKREVLLNQIWGDEGAYVGRTLDVFVSKLRKKLDQDESIRILNSRGVGYKLVLSE